MTTGHVLLVADTYGAQADSRSHALSNALSAVGWNVNVLTASPVPAVRESSRTPDGGWVRVINVPTPTHPADPILNAWPAARHKDPHTWATKDQAARAASWFDDELALWRPRLEATALNVESSHHVDLVVCLVPHLTTLAIGSLFFSLFRTPYAIDMTALPEVGTDRDEWRWMVGNSTFRWCSDIKVTSTAGSSFEHVEQWTPDVLSGVLSEWNRQT